MKRCLCWIICAGLLAGAAVVARAQTPAALPVLTPKAYAQSNPEDIYVVLLSADYCGPCHLLEKQVLLGLAEFYKNDKQVHVVKVDLTDGTAAKEEPLFQTDRMPVVLVLHRRYAAWKKEGYLPKQKQELFDKIKQEVAKLK